MPRVKSVPPWNMLVGLEITLFSTKDATSPPVGPAEGTGLSLQPMAYSCAEPAARASWLFPWPVLDRLTPSPLSSVLTVFGASKRKQFACICFLGCMYADA